MMQRWILVLCAILGCKSDPPAASGAGSGSMTVAGVSGSATGSGSAAGSGNAAGGGNATVSGSGSGSGNSSSSSDGSAAGPSVVTPEDRRAIQKLVETNVHQLAESPDSDDSGLLLAPNAIVVLPHGEPPEKVDEPDAQQCRTDTVTGAYANHMGCALYTTVRHAPPKPVFSVIHPTHRIAWFQAPFTATVSNESPDDGKVTKEKVVKRAGGIAIGSGSTWSIAAIMYTETLPDRALLARVGVEPGKPAVSGDPVLGAAVAKWIAGGFASNAAQDQKQLVASGTAATEFATEAAAHELAAGWDKLKLSPLRVDAKLLAGGAIGWATAHVAMPRKGRGPVELVLGVVAIPESGGWRWVSLQFLAAVVPW